MPEGAPTEGFTHSPEQHSDGWVQMAPSRLQSGPVQSL